jgi:hypothetical protein
MELHAEKNRGLSHAEKKHDQSKETEFVIEATTESMSVEYTTPTDDGSWMADDAELHTEKNRGLPHAEKKHGQSKETEEERWEAAVSADYDSRMLTPFKLSNGTEMTLSDYLYANPTLLPWRDFISPHRLSMLDGVTNPFLVLSPLFLAGVITEAQRGINIHNNGSMLFHLGISDAFDTRYLNGIEKDVNTIANTLANDDKREIKKAENDAKKKRKAMEQNEIRELKKEKKEQDGMVRASSKKADMARRAQAEENKRYVRAEVKEKGQRNRAEAAERGKQPKSRDKGVDAELERLFHLKDEENHYNTLLWAQSSPPSGMARHVATDLPILFAEVPEIVRDSLHWLMAYRLSLNNVDPLTNEMLFRNVSRYYGRPVGAYGVADYTKLQWRSWQLQRRIHDTSTTFLGQYSESILAALVNAASIIDPSIDSSESALSWIRWILEEKNAKGWLRDRIVVIGLREQANYRVRVIKTRVVTDRFDEIFKKNNRNYIAPNATHLIIPHRHSTPPQPPPPPYTADLTPPMPSTLAFASTLLSIAGSSSDTLPMPSTHAFASTLLSDAGSSSDTLPMPAEGANTSDHNDVVDLHWNLMDSLTLLESLDHLPKSLEFQGSP